MSTHLHIRDTAEHKVITKYYLNARLIGVDAIFYILCAIIIYLNEII